MAKNKFRDLANIVRFKCEDSHLERLHMRLQVRVLGLNALTRGGLAANKFLAGNRLGEGL